VTIFARAVAGALALALLVPVAAAAQPARNPFADLFGRTPERTGREFTAVQFRSTVGAQVGQTLEAGLLELDSVIPEGLSARGDAMLSVEYMRDRVRFSGLGRYAYQEFRQPPAFGAPALNVGGRVDLKATTRLAFHGSGQYFRSPFFRSMWVTPDAAHPMAPMDDLAILMLRNDTVQGSAGLASAYTKRSSISVTGTIRKTDFEAQTQAGFSSVGGRAEWRRQVTRDMALRAAYGRDELRSRAADGEVPYTQELVDIGIDYGHALSLARRTSFTFGTQTSILRDRERGRHFRLNGDIAFDHRFQRTWAAHLSARRGSDFLPGFRDPVLTDSARMSVDGFLATRLILKLDADAGRGEIGFDDGRQFMSYAGHAKLTFALMRNLGVFTQYTYYNYQSPPQRETLFLVPRGVRQAVSVGVETWISIYNKDRVPRDPR
jgi:hypothetical protein